MPKVKEKTVTDVKLSEFFKITTQTLRNWKNGSQEYKRRYLALREYYQSFLSK